MNVSSIQSINFKTVAPLKNQEKVTSPIAQDAPKVDVMSYMANLGKQAMIKPNLNKSTAISFTGWAPEKHNEELISSMVKIIKAPDVQKIAVSGHTSPDGDSIGSSFAMANLINQATGKKVDMFVFGQLPKRYEYLNTNPEVNVIAIKENGKKENADNLIMEYGKYDLAISLDCAEYKLMNADYAKGILKNATHSLKIDHHPYKEEFNEKYNTVFNNKFAKINLIDNSLPAAAEITMQFVEPLGLKPEELRKETKDAMFTGMLTDTGCFKYANTPLTFEDAALLMKAGVNNREVNLNALGNTAEAVLEVEKLCLNKIQYSDDKKIAYVIEDADIKAAKKECTNQGLKQEGKDAVKGVCGRLPEIEGVEVGFKVAEFGGSASFSIRSRDLDVSEIARKHGGGGHTHAGAFSIPKEGRSTEEVVKQLVKELNEAMAK